MSEAPRVAARELSSKALAGRGGGGGVAQEQNLAAGYLAQRPANVQRFKDADMKDVTIAGVQQVADRALFFRNNRWVDNAILAHETEAPDQTVEFGTPEFQTVLDQLVKEGRQGMLARGGDVYLEVQGRRVLVRCPL